MSATGSTDRNVSWKTVLIAVRCDDKCNVKTKVICGSGDEGQSTSTGSCAIAELRPVIASRLNDRIRFLAS